MNRYETFIIFEADLAEEDRKTILDRVGSLVSDSGGTTILFDEWGTRKLAYPIRKKNQGYYVRMDYCGRGKAVEAIERILRQDTRILRFMTVRMATDADPEALLAEMAPSAQESAPEEPAGESTEEAAKETAGEAAGEASGETAGDTAGEAREAPASDAAAETETAEEPQSAGKE